MGARGHDTAWSREHHHDSCGGRLFHICLILFILLSYLIFDFVCLMLSSANTHGIAKYARTYIRDTQTHRHTHIHIHIYMLRLNSMLLPSRWLYGKFESHEDCDKTHDDRDKNDFKLFNSICGSPRDAPDS